MNKHQHNPLENSENRAFVTHNLEDACCAERVYFLAGKDIYKFAVKTPQQQFEGNTTSVVIPLYECHSHSVRPF
jgi:hypothetical protein